VKRLLLIEDEPGLVLTLRDRLTREGYALETSEDGESGLERASREVFDLVLLDVMLPRMNGFDVLRELRKRGTETPVIMLTAKGQVVDKVVGLKLGADDYVTKPFEMVELLARIEAKLRRAPAVSHPAGGDQFDDVAGLGPRHQQPLVRGPGEQPGAGHPGPDRHRPARRGLQPPGLVERRPAIIVHDPDRPSGPPIYFMLLDWADDRLLGIRDFRYARYAVGDAELIAFP